jgi:DNA-directed RNA polymerase subunit RPC12/RpoP
MDREGALMADQYVCGRCYNEVDALVDSSCAEKPEHAHGALGMYHCPDCGMMVMAGMPHPKVCMPCAAELDCVYV